MVRARHPGYPDGHQRHSCHFFCVQVLINVGNYDRALPYLINEILITRHYYQESHHKLPG